ncbi:MAG: riboflavin kinase, partial [Carnobacterium sp.]
FNGEIYGEKLTVLWLDKIRDMIKFDGIDQLIKQMKEDEQIARDFKA